MSFFHRGDSEYLTPHIIASDTIWKYLVFPLNLRGNKTFSQSQRWLEIYPLLPKDGAGLPSLLWGL